MSYITPDEIKSRVITFLAEHNSEYTEREIRYIERYATIILERPINHYIGDVLRQIYDEVGLLPEENNMYSGFVSLLEKNFNLDTNIVEVAGGVIPVLAKKIAFNSAIADQTHNIFKNVCTYVNKTPWIATLQHDGAYVNRTITEHDYHSQGLAIDLNDLWTYTGSDGTVYNPYGGQGTWTWTKYKKFICEVCDGQEDCQYNINYIIFKRYFEGNGWCWGGNWSPAYFDPMHFEVRAGGCSSANKQRITCE